MFDTMQQQQGLHIDGVDTTVVAADGQREYKFYVDPALCNPSMIAAASSYAGLTPLEYALLRTELNDVKSKDMLCHALLSLIDKHVDDGLNVKYISKVLAVAMFEYDIDLELRPLSRRSRAALACLADTTWRRNRLCDYVDKIIVQINQAVTQAHQKIQQQITIIS